MGWCESPPFFCAVTKIARDIIATIMKKPLPPHPLEHKMLPLLSTDKPIWDQLFDTILPEICTIIKVYADDFVGMTNVQQRAYLRHLSLLNSIIVCIPTGQYCHVRYVYRILFSRYVCLQGHTYHIYRGY